MFQNLSLKGFTWPREPVLYMALLVAILNIAVGLINGTMDWNTAWETLVIAVGAFVARGQVSPTS